MINPDSIVFYDAIVLLGTPGVNQTEKELRVVGYRVDNVNYWVATDRYDLQTPLEHGDLLCLAETPFQNLSPDCTESIRVNGANACSHYNLYPPCYLLSYEFGEKVKIRRARELRIKIKNETRGMGKNCQHCIDGHKQKNRTHYMQILNRTLLTLAGFQGIMLSNLPTLVSYS